MFDQTYLSSAMNKLTQALTQAQNLLLNASLNPELPTILTTAFGENYNPTEAHNIFSLWRNQDFSNLPPIQILPPTILNNAQGGYSATTNTIYLSSTLLEQQSFLAIRNVLLEEIGHFIDAQINYIDTPGDEGAIFSALVQGKTLTENQLSKLREEDDTATIYLDGETIEIEQNTITKKPNLVVTNFTAPTITGSGQTIEVSWTVQNQGEIATYISPWYDYIIYSKDNIQGNDDDVYLKNRWYGSDYDVVRVYESLEPNQSYTYTRSVTIPRNVIGNGYLFVNANGGESQPETKTDDNSKAIAITTTKPNLVVTNFTAPTITGSGQTIEVSWTVQNQGDIATYNTDYWSSYSWYDAVIYSQDNILGNEDDVYLDDYYFHNKNPYPILDIPLEPNQSYTITDSFQIPDNATGDGYLFLQTNIGEQLPETDTTDNVRSIAITTTKPNLVVTNFTAPILTGSGEWIEVSWTVQNQGDIATYNTDYWSSYSWYDAVIYSQDDILGNEDDVYLDDDYYYNPYPINAYLEPNQSYTMTNSFQIPDNATDDGYLFLQTNIGEQLPETNYSDNVKLLTIFDITKEFTVVGGDPLFSKNIANPYFRDANFKIVSTPDEQLNKSYPAGKDVWLVFHGWNGDFTKFENLGKTIAKAKPNDIVLALDWRQMAHTIYPTFRS